MLNDKLLQFVDMDLHDVKVFAQFSSNILFVNFTLGLDLPLNLITSDQDARKRFDKASLLYDQVMLFSVHFKVTILNMSSR